MANQLKMAVANAIITLNQRGWSNRRIARELGIDRETVKRHLKLARNGSKPATNALPGSAVAEVGEDQDQSGKSYRLKDRAAQPRVGKNPSKKGEDNQDNTCKKQEK